jgi:hypothetical protein
MPKVGKKEFPYTAKGMAMAKAAAKKTGKGVAMAKVVAKKTGKPTKKVVQKKK